MFTEKEIEKINRFLSDQTFECSSPLFGGGTTPDFNFEYRFEITGLKQMISVGEWYDNVKVNIEIINIEDKYKPFYGIMGKNFKKEELTNIFFKEDYIFRYRLGNCIRETLAYFASEEVVRLFFDNTTISDDLYNEIKNTQDTA